ncbi:MAG: hypothetical protein ACLQUW_08035 [Desulfobaccales bacterium]
MNDDWTLEKPDASAPPTLDYLIRVRGSSGDKDIGISITETGKFKKHFDNIYDRFNFVKNTLVEVILSQRTTLAYNGFYNAFLMGQLPENRFVKIAKKFAYRPRTINNKELSNKINILLDLTKIDYTPSELADIFKCNVDHVRTAIESISNSSKSLEAL